MRAVDEGLLRADLPPGWIYAVLPSLMLHAAEELPDLTAAQAADLVVDTLLRGPGSSPIQRRVRQSAVVRASPTHLLALEEEGSFPLRSHVLHIGIRFPLGVASAGLAIIAHLPAEERQRYLEVCDLSAEFGDAHSAKALRDRVARTLTNGYAVNPGLLVEGSWGIGAAVFDHSGRPAWALSITGVESRLRPPRLERLGSLLLAEAHTPSQRLRLPDLSVR